MARKTRGAGKPQDSAPDSVAQPPPGRPGEDFWRTWTPEELVVAQGVRPVERFEDLLGRGRDFWTDEEFAEFQKWLLESRRARGEG